MVTRWKGKRNISTLFQSNIFYNVREAPKVSNKFSSFSRLKIAFISIGQFDKMDHGGGGA
jgi:hypothetical protein